MPTAQHEQFKKFIIKTLAGDVIYDAANNSFYITQRPIHQYRSIINEQGQQWHIASPMIDHIVKQATDAMHGAQASIKQTKAFVDTRLLKAGDVLCLEGEGKLGLSTLELMCLGRRTEMQFYILESSLTALHPADIVEPAGNAMWAPNNPVRLKVFRRGQRYPDTKQEFLIEKCTQIAKLEPTLIHEVIDSSDSFTYIEDAMRQAGGGDGTLSFGRNPMSLLLHEFSTLLPAYADFDSAGKGSYALNADVALSPHAQRSLLVDCGKENAAKAVHVKTQTPGCVAIDATTGMPGVYEKAKVQVVKATTYSGAEDGATKVATDVPGAPTAGCISADEMLLLIENVERIVRSGDAAATADHVPNLRLQFRHCGVSILALIRLLNYFLAPPAISEYSTVGFVGEDYVHLDSGSFERQLIDLRQNYQNLKRQLGDAEAEAKRWHSQAITAWIFAAVAAAGCIVLLVI